MITKVSNLSRCISNLGPSQLNKALILIGSGGRELWPHVKPLVDLKKDHPIDQYSLESLKYLGTQIDLSGLEILFPNHHLKDLPLQQISRTLNFSASSTIGIDICQEYGLWFAFRLAILIDHCEESYPNQPALSPCETCLDKPCLNESDFELKRLACPYKIEHQYSPEQRSYHARILTTLKGSSTN